MHRFKTLFSALAVAGGLVATGAQAAQEVNVYSYRQPFLIEPIFDAFTRETGIKVNVVFAKTGLEERLKREGKNSPADLILTVDVGRMDDLVNDGLTQPVSSEKLNTNIPASYRDPEGRWFSLTSRARVLFASRERVPEGTVKTYEELADPKWKGKLCSRSGKHAYNVALIASMIAHHGEADAEKWLKGVKDNLARKPQGGDRDQIKAIKEGVCDLAIGNSYYYGNMLTDEEASEAARAAYLVYPNQQDRGTHINISGVALTQSAPNKANAVRLIEFLSEGAAQRMYAEQNFEYPINPNEQPSGLVASWGSFKADALPLTEIAKHRDAAVKLVDRIGFDN